MSRFADNSYVEYNGEKRKVKHHYSDGDVDLEGVSGYVRARYLTAWKEPKVSSLTLVGKGLLGLKLKMPTGVKLNDAEAKYVIDGWESQKSVVRTKQSDLQSVSMKIERHLAKTSQEIEESMKVLKQARAQFKKTKEPLARRKWARKVVVRTAYYEQVRNSHHALTATVDRVSDAVDDAQYVYKTLESRIAEARIYRELNGGLQLVGKSLLEARTKHILPEVEFNNLEVTMEAIEQGVSQKDDDTLLLEAETIVNDPSRWSSDEGQTSENKKSPKKG